MVRLGKTQGGFTEIIVTKISPSNQNKKLKKPSIIFCKFQPMSAKKNTKFGNVTPFHLITNLRDTVDGQNYQTDFETWNEIVTLEF